MKWLKNLFKKNDVEKAELIAQIYNQQALISGLQHAILTIETERLALNAIGIALMLEIGTTEKIIDGEFVNTIGRDRTELRYSVNDAGNMSCWVEQGGESEPIEEPNE